MLSMFMVWDLVEMDWSLTAFAGIRRWFGTGFKSKEEVEKEEQQRRDEINEERRVKGKKPLETTKREGEMGKA